MRLKGYLCVLAAAVMWGLIGPIAKIAFESGMPPLETAFWRTVFGWIFFGIHALRAGEYRIAPKDVPLVCAFGVAGIAGLFGNYVVAVEHGGAALSAVLLYTAPAWVAVMSHFLFKEPLGISKIAAIILTMAGVALVSLGPQFFSPDAVTFNAPALTFGLLSGFCYALYYVFGKHYLGRYTTPALFLYAMPVGALTLVPFFGFSAHPPSAWIAVMVLGLCSTYLAYSIYYAGLRHLEATRAAIVATLEPVVAAYLAYVMWDESFSAAGYFGSALILAGVLLSMIEGEHIRSRVTRRIFGNNG